MSFKLGNTTIGELYVGSNKIAQAYLGSNLVYQAATPIPTPSFDEVTIGTQTWITKNLDIDDGGEGIYYAEIISEDNINFGIQYYYTWNAAIRIANKINGWHLPSKSEWDTLINTVGGSPGGSYVWNLAGRKLKSTTGWSDNGNGTNEYGFNVLPTGKRTQSGSLYDIGYCTGFWTSTEDGDYVYSIHLDCDTSQALRILDQTTKQSFMNIRLIKD